MINKGIHSKKSGQFKQRAAPPLVNLDFIKGLPSWAEINPYEDSLPKIIAVGGGKGGVGKSLVSANIAAQLALSGARTLVVDLDVGGPNLHTYFGLPMPSPTLNSYWNDRQVTFSDLLIPCPVPRLAMIAGGSSAEAGKHTLNKEHLSRFWCDLKIAKNKYKISYVILDLGAGSQEYTVELFSCAHLGILTILPEPTSIENAYVFLKAHLWKLIENSGYFIDNPREAAMVQRELLKGQPNDISNGYFAKLQNLFHAHPTLIKCLGSAITSRKIGIIINQARNSGDRDIGGSIEEICRQFFGLKTTSLGYLNYDEAAWKSLRNKRLLSKDFPHSLITKRIRSICKNINKLTV